VRSSDEIEDKQSKSFFCNELNTVIDFDEFEDAIKNISAFSAKYSIYEGEVYVAKGGSAIWCMDDLIYTGG